MRLTFRCLPELEALLPRPVPARAALPDWLKAMPATVASDTLGGAEVRTLKHCPPLIDAMMHGVLMPLAADVTVADGTLSWDWDCPPLGASRLTRAPVGVHVPEQAAGAPLGLAPGRFIVKFTNFWAIEAPEGWSVLFTHPLNREELPFRTVTGLVDCDRYADGFVHFPALWTDPGFTGVLPRGTPVAQCIPVPRQAIEIACETIGGDQLAAHLELQDALRADPGLYRKRFREGR